MHGLALAQPRPAQKAYIGASECFRLPQSYQQKLQDLAAQHQLTPFMLMHAALALLLSRHSNSHDIVIGTPVANRLYAELEGFDRLFRQCAGAAAEYGAAAAEHLLGTCT